MYKLFSILSRIQLDSVILNKSDKKTLDLICEFPFAKTWMLKYRATRDGLYAKDFHERCDGFSNSLTIIKSKNGNLFGGFVEKAWDSSTGAYLHDPKAFIFSLVNKENKPFKVLCSNNGENAIWCSSTFGPTFGDDIVLRSSSNTIQEGWSNFGFSYKHGSYQKGTLEAKSILAGSENFQILEIEVFTAIN